MELTLTGTRSVFRERLARLLAMAGVRINGDRPWDPRVHDSRFYRRVAFNGTLGAGEAWMDGWWDCDRLDELASRVLRAGLERELPGFANAYLALRSALFNLQKPARAFLIGRRHYDIGNDLYRRMLDPLMTYSCGYWRSANDLAAAQEAKLDLVCRKLKLEPGMRVLDIGCGWGGAAYFAATRYGVNVTGITVSREQAQLAAERCRDLPVRIHLQDYRDLEGEYDRVFSIGMFEHVGHKNYRTYMDVVRRVLKPDGLFLLHTIGSTRSRNHTDPWVARYIFPNSMLPSVAQVGAAIDGRFIMEDWHEFGTDYDTTLMAWHGNFVRRWPEIADRYGERFFRMWRYYLLVAAGAFRARSNQLWQIVLSPNGVPGGYRAPR